MSITLRGRQFFLFEQELCSNIHEVSDRNNNNEYRVFWLFHSRLKFHRAQRHVTRDLLTIFLPVPFAVWAVYGSQACARRP